MTLRLQIPLALAASLLPVGATPDTISDQALLRYAATPWSKSSKMFTHESLGVNHGTAVIVDYPCGDVCPDYTTQIIHYAVAPGPDCAAAGGVVAQFLIPAGPAVRQKNFCVPAVLAPPKPSPGGAHGAGP